MVVLVRALSGGEVDDRDAVKVARAVRADSGDAGRAGDALVRALERADVQGAPGRERALGLHTAAGAVFGGVGGAMGLWAMGAAHGGGLRWAAVLPLLGVAAVLYALVRVRRFALDGLALPVAVAHELMRVGVSHAVAVEAAVHVAGARGADLRAALADLPLPELAEVPRDRAAAALLSARLDDAQATERARNGARAGVLAGAVWVVASFWLVWIFGLSRGLAEVLP